MRECGSKSYFNYSNIFDELNKLFRKREEEIILKYQKNIKIYMIILINLF